MSVKINGAVSGSVTIDAPATGGDVSLILPTFGFGKVLQVVTANTSNTLNTTSSTFVDASGLSISITPNSIASRIIVLVSLTARAMGPGGSNNCYFSWALLRGSTIIFDGTVQTGNFGSTDFRGFAGTTYIDSPATTSATTYKVQFASNFASQVFINSSAGSSSITAIEVGP